MDEVDGEVSGWRGGGGVGRVVSECRGRGRRKNDPRALVLRGLVDGMDGCVGGSMEWVSTERGDWMRGWVGGWVGGGVARGR